MDREAWKAIVHMDTESQIWLKQLSLHALEILITCLLRRQMTNPDQFIYFLASSDIFTQDAVKFQHRIKF